MKTLQIVVSPTDNPAELKYLLGILASRLINYWCVNYLSDDINQSYLDKIPIRIINPIDLTNKEFYSSMVSLVDQMLCLRAKLADVNAAHDKTLIERQIGDTDDQIDKLVYRLYGLTIEEIEIVEGRDRDEH